MLLSYRLLLTVFSLGLHNWRRVGLIINLSAKTIKSSNLTPDLLLNGGKSGWFAQQLVETVISLYAHPLL